MQYLSLFVIFISSLSFGQTIPSYSGEFPDLKSQGIEQMVELGTGTRISNDIEALIKIEFIETAKIGNDDSDVKTRFVIARIKTDLSFGMNVSYIDAEFNGLGVQIQDQTGMISFNALNVKIQRNIDIGLSQMMRVSFIGFRGSFEDDSNKSLRFIAEGAIDLLGVAYTERLKDNSHLDTKNYYGGNIDIGIDFNRKFKIIIGGDYASFLGNPLHKDSIICTDENHCFEKRETEYLHTSSISSVYAKLLINVNKNMRLYTKVAMSYFEEEDRTQVIESTSDKKIQIQSGLLYLF